MPLAFNDISLYIDSIPHVGAHLRRSHLDDQQMLGWRCPNQYGLVTLGEYALHYLAEGAMIDQHAGCLLKQVQEMDWNWSSSDSALPTTNVAVAVPATAFREFRRALG